MSIWEFGLVALVALVVIGPKRLPQIVRQFGKWYGRMRRLRESLLKDMPESKKNDTKKQ